MQWDDLPLLLAWFRQPHVKAWWRDEPDDLEAIEAEYGACITGEDPTELFVIESDGRAVGMIQRYRFADEPEWITCFDGILDVGAALGIDYLVGEPDAVGKGIGTAAIAELVAATFAGSLAASVVTNVDIANVASWRALEKVGFRRVWEGEIDSPDPSDTGPQYVYEMTAQ
jgi:aminoglycoside 6'-N-acetyltransferase